MRVDRHGALVSSDWSDWFVIECNEEGKKCNTTSPSIDKYPTEENEGSFDSYVDVRTYFLKYLIYK